jgi:hypothetical protein
VRRASSGIAKDRSFLGYDYVDSAVPVLRRVFDEGRDDGFEDELV